MSELLHTIEPWADAWGASLWRASWQGGLVVLAAWAITRWCKFLSPRVACWIWRLACIKMLVGLISVQPVAIPLLPAVSPPTLAANSETRAPAAQQTEIAPMRVDSEARPVSASSKLPVGQAMQSNWKWLLALWLIGVGYRVSLTARQWKSVLRLRRSAEPARSTALQDVCRCEADHLEIRRLPRIRFSPHTNVPLLAGIWRPMILLPAGALEAFDDCELRLMLGHELAHLKRRDLLWNWLPTVVGWLFFFHPLIWLLPRRWSEAQEAACDELLIQNETAGAVSYGRLLVKLAARWPAQRRPELMTAGVLGTYRNLERRILAMVRVKPISRRSLLVAAAAASLVAVLGIIPWRLVAQEPKADKTAAPQVATGEAEKNGHGQWLGASIDSPTPQIVIADHVLLWNNEILTWEQVVQGLRAMRAAGPFRGAFYLTIGVDHKEKEGWRFWNDRIMSMYGELFAPVGVTVGSLSPRGSQKFDAVRTKDDLQPKPAHKWTGRLLAPDGKPAPGAQVLVLPSKGDEVTLKGTEVYNPLNEQWAPTDETGGFTIYPDEDDYWIAALHPSGFILERGPAKGAELTVRLQPWAVVSFSSTGEVAGQFAAIYSHPIGAGLNWPRFDANPFKTKGKPIDVKVPAGKIVVQRFLEMKEGVSIAAPPMDTFPLNPGERRTLAIAPVNDDDRAAATATFEDGQNRSRADAKNNATPPPATSPASKDKSGADKAPDPGKEPPRGARDEQGSEMLRDLRRKVTPIVAAMAKEHGYRLDKNQNLRRVAPPFPAIRMEWYRVANPTQSSYIPAGPGALVFGWSNDRLETSATMTFGDPIHGGYDVVGLLDALAGIKRPMIDGPRELLDEQISGDWVIRSGVSDEQIVKELVSVLNNDLSSTIRMDFREVQRPVYVVEGTYRHQPVPGGRDKDTTTYTDKTVTSDAIEVFGKQLVPNSGSGGGTGSFREFLDWLGRWIGTPIVSDVKTFPQGELTWYLHERSPSTEATRDEDHDAKLVLANITAQTGLRFREEMRAVKTLFVSRTK